MKVLNKFLWLVAITIFTGCLSHNNRIPASVESNTGISLESEIMYPGPELEKPFYENENHQIDIPVEDGQEFATYKARGGETLMLVAFEAYSDYKKWRMIANANPGLKDSQVLKRGEVLNLPKPLKPFSPPRGRPYLIKAGDSLSLISKKVYGQFKFWNLIYENNREQIPKPNLIFAGFTLFYPSDPLIEQSFRLQ